MPEKPRKIAIDDPDYLRRWFQLSGHPYLVFKVADLLEMTAGDQDLMVELVLNLEPAQGRGVDDRFYGASGSERRSALQRIGFRGYIKFDVEALGMMSMETITGLQSFFNRYRQIRGDKFEPSTWEHCQCTHGGTRPADNNCKCAGAGKIWTLHEVSEVESALAEGKDWDEIDTQ